MIGNAVVVGAGLGGLAVSAALARMGWSVETFEQAQELREDGACIWLGEMALATLGRLGAAEEVVGYGTDVEYWEMIGHDGSAIQSGGPRVGSPGRLHWLPRTDLHRALVNAARAAGVSITTSARVASVEGGNVVRLVDGSERRPDLLIGADGVHSIVRKSLNFEARARPMGHVLMREVIDYEDESIPQKEIYEHWASSLRIGYGWHRKGSMGIWLSLPVSDGDDLAGWYDPGQWTRAFPPLRRMVHALADAKPVARRLIDVRCGRWVHGNVAIIGDAAHAMAPHFGQGGGLAMADGWALAEGLGSPSRYRDTREIADALRAWETRHRWLADTTQRYARLYTNVQSYVLRPLERPRARLLRWLGSSGTAIKVNDGLLFQSLGPSRS